MKSFVTILGLILVSLVAMVSCKSGCGCHGDPFGELNDGLESNEVIRLG